VKRISRISPSLVNPFIQLEVEQLAKSWIHLNVVSFHGLNSGFRHPTDREQRELYEAAKVIQKAYRSYKGRKKLEEEEKEKVAAVIIQNYYRRYKEVSQTWANQVPTYLELMKGMVIELILFCCTRQYAYLRQVTQAALVIQNQYRNYCENKRFKKSQESDKYRLRENVSSFNNNPGIT